MLAEDCLQLVELCTLVRRSFLTFFDDVSYRLRPVIWYRGLGQEGKLLCVVIKLPVIDFIFFVIFATVGEGCHTICVVVVVDCCAISSIAMAMVIAVPIVITMVVVEDIVLATGVVNGGIFAFSASGFLTGCCIQNGFAGLHRPQRGLHISPLEPFFGTNSRNIGQRIRIEVILEKC